MSFFKYWKEKYSVFHVAFILACPSCSWSKRWYLGEKKFRNRRNHVATDIIFCSWTYCSCFNSKIFALIASLKIKAFAHAALDVHNLHCLSCVETDLSPINCGRVLSYDSAKHALSTILPGIMWGRACTNHKLRDIYKHMYVHWYVYIYIYLYTCVYVCIYGTWIPKPVLI